MEVEDDGMKRREEERISMMMMMMICLGQRRNKMLHTEDIKMKTVDVEPGRGREVYMYVCMRREKKRKEGMV